METEEVTNKLDTSKRKPGKPTEAFRKIDGVALKMLTQFREKANKKEFGRKVRDSEIIELALTLLTDQHIAELQRKTFSNKDLLNMKHQEYLKTKGKIGFDEFLGKLMQGEI